MERFDLVQKAYDELKALGVVRDSDVLQPEAVLEEMKGRVTLRAAYYVNQVNLNRGLLAKTSGNNYKGFKADVIMDKDGTTFDILTDNGKKIILQNPGGNPEPNLKDLWRQPTKELAGLNGAPPVDNPPVDDGDDELIAALQMIDKDVKIVISNQLELMNRQSELLKMIQLVYDKPIEVPPVKFPDYELKGNRTFNSLFGTVTATKKNA